MCSHGLSRQVLTIKELPILVKLKQKQSRRLVSCEEQLAINNDQPSHIKFRLTKKWFLATRLHIPDRNITTGVVLSISKLVVGLAYCTMLPSPQKRTRFVANSGETAFPWRLWMWILDLSIVYLFKAVKLVQSSTDGVHGAVRGPLGLLSLYLGTRRSSGEGANVVTPFTSVGGRWIPMWTGPYDPPSWYAANKELHTDPFHTSYVSIHVRSSGST